MTGPESFESAHRPNTLGLRDRELTQLLGNFEKHAVSPSETVDREYARWPFRTTSCPVTLIHPGGTEVNLRLACRNLSRGGIGLLHAAFVHPGSRMIVELPKREGGASRLEGTVARCLHREGVIHEVGVRFDDPISIRDYVRPDLFEGWLSYERISAADVKGSMIHVEPNAIDQKIVRHFLRDTSVRVRTFANGHEALDSAREGCDLVLFDLGASERLPRDFIAALRAEGCNAPVVLTATQPTPDQQAAIRSSGASAFLRKPFEGSTMLLAAAEFLIDPPKHAPTAGDLQSTPGPQLAGAYANKLCEYADELDALVDDNRQIDAYVICVQIKGTAPTLGFRSIGDRAGWLANRIASGVKLPQIRTQVTELTQACRKLRAA